MAFGSEVSDEGETLVVTQVSRKPRRMVWAGLAGVIAMCAIGVMAMSRFQRRTPLDHVTRMGGLMRAFTKRALQDKSDLTSKVGFTFKEVGADDPSTTGVKVVMQVDADAGDDSPVAPVLKIIFNAKEGKADDLVSHFSDAKDMFLQILEEEHGEETAAGMKDLTSIEQVPDKDEVLITLNFPSLDPRMDMGDEDMGDEVEQDMENEVPPEMTAEIFFGRSIKDMFESRDTVVIPKLPNGIKISASMKMATAMLSMQEQMGGLPVDPFTRAFYMGLASVGLDAEVLYKAEDDLADKWDVLDSKHAWDEAIAMVQSLPAAVTEKLAGVDEAADGIKSAAVTGLPDKVKVEATFTNFKIAEVVKALLEAPRPRSFWR